MLIGNGQANSQELILPLRLADNCLDFSASHSAERREKSPLVLIRDKALVQEEAVAVLAWSLLKGQSDQVAKAASGEGILTGEEVAKNALASSCQEALSKSAARNQHVSSGSMG